MPGKQHSISLKNPKLFLKNWLKMEHVDVKDGSRLCSLVTYGSLLGSVPVPTTLSFSADRDFHCQ
jgi:hypothetical protein